MPEEPKTSKLTVITNKKKQQTVTIAVETKKGSASFPVGRALSSDLEATFKANSDELNGMEVHYEMESGKVSKIWKKGGKWQGEIVKPSYATATPQRKPQQGQGRFARPQGSQGQPRHQPYQTTEAFHNPYNFVPALPRKQVNNELGDHSPLGHHVYHTELWSGWIQVELTTATPLLLPDAAQALTHQDDHNIYPVRVDANGAPYLPPTSLKGMLRTAYETVTNSRLSIFEKHDNRLAYRRDARSGIEMVPAVVEKGTAGLELRLLPNHTTIEPNGAPQNGQMYAAWLPRYQKFSKDTPRYPDGKLPQHGDTVWVKFQHEQHQRPYFSLLRVTDIMPRSQDQEQGGPAGYQAGIVCITGRNIKNKHDERVFLLSPNDPKLELTRSLIKNWETLIDNYQTIHADDLKKREKEGQKPDAYLGSEPGKTAWSRHIYTKNAVQLKEGSLCYARIANQNVLGMYPVMITRDLFNETPKNLLPLSLHPPTSYEELSPVDRVFGWVHKDGKGAWKGQLRIEPAECELGKEAIEDLGADGIPLAILGEPKPQQNGFYVAHNRQGEPLPDGRDKAAGYSDKTQGLRGRKIYPHHAHLARLHDYWLKPREDRTQKQTVSQGKRYYQEYRRPTLTDDNGKEKTRDNQNRSILGWIKPETTFRFKVQIRNLSSVELGALLWLLHQDKNCYHRLGSSKPLGFGSVHLQIQEMELRQGRDWAEFYQNFLGTDTPCLRHVNEAQPHIEAYKQAVAEAYGKSFEQVSFIKAFRVALRGFANALPMHYPRLDEKPSPNGESFKWFVQNDKTKGPHLALPSLEEQKGLPLLTP
ncbi:MAG: TIGR03986 family CRISPR-associated RAMP protein [Candidatus Parabeggiatoa sp. nov. 1]|nr:MAG: TIGR03986 family CRISPR-associated RAMP protein [Gammaproteobacteria bacterium]